MTSNNSTEYKIDKIENITLSLVHHGTKEIYVIIDNDMCQTYKQEYDYVICSADIPISRYSDFVNVFKESYGVQYTLNYPIYMCTSDEKAKYKFEQAIQYIKKTEEREVTTIDKHIDALKEHIIALRIKYCTAKREYDNLMLIYNAVNDAHPEQHYRELSYLNLMNELKDKLDNLKNNIDASMILYDELIEYKNTYLKDLENVK